MLSVPIISSLPAMSQKIIRQDYNEKAFKAKLIPALKSHPKGATLADLVVATGLSQDWTEYTLRQLMNEYPAHLEINQDHKLVYIFDFQPRQNRGWSAWWQSFLATLYTTLTFVFKAWILLMMFTYLLFNVILLAVAATLVSRNSTVIQNIMRALMRIGPEVRKMFLQNGKLSDGLVHAVFSYVFGPDKKDNDELKLEKRILEFIRLNQGQLLVSDIVKLTGWSRRQAEEEAAQLLANYQGEAEVSEEGLIIYQFPELDQAPKASRRDPDALLVWKNPLPRRRMNDNEEKLNQKITWTNAFNALMAIISPLIIQYLFYSEGGTLSFTLLFWTMIFPLCFSILFFLIPLLRRPFVRSENQKIEKINQGYQFLEYLFKNLPRKIYAQFYPEDQVAILSQVYFRNLEKWARDLEAESKVDQSGVMYYHFDQIEREIQYQNL